MEKSKKVKAMNDVFDKSILVKAFREVVNKASKEILKEYYKRFPERQRRIWQNPFYCPHLKELLRKNG